MHISHSIVRSASAARASKSKKSSRRKPLLGRLFATKRARRRAVRYGIIAANLALIGGVAGFLLTTEQNGLQKVSLATASPDSSAVVVPLDTLSSSDVAVQVARLTGLTEATAVTNQSDSIKVNAVIAQADSSVVSKPQIVGEKQRTADDIQKYIVVAGDSVSTVAAKFGVTSESIRWSNSLSGEALRIGTELTIPPVNGVVYTVASGDTPEKIAQRYQASASQIIAFNDAEINGLVPGQRIVIPNGKQPAAPVYTAFAARYGYNGYDYGWCTYYAASRVSVPTNWGNANTWASRARLTPGWTVSSKPVPGAIAQHTAGRWGHVAVVDEVHPDGTMIKYSDMNGLAGWNKVGHSGWVPISKFPNYIYR